MSACHLKSRYIFHQIIPTSHLLSSSNHHVSTPMSTLHPVQFALTFFRFVSVCHSVTLVDFGWSYVRTSGPLSIASKPFSCLCNLFSEVEKKAVHDACPSLTLILEPNNASPLNTDASNLWESPESELWPFCCERDLTPEFSVQITASEVLPTGQR